MNAIQTKLKDAYLITNNIFSDNRGSFSESFNLREIQKIIGSYDFVQDCHSISSKNVIRGMHYQIQHAQGKLVRCIVGEVYDVIVDIRKSSPTFGQWFGTILYPGPLQLWVPPGFAHGFLSLVEGSEVLYKVTDYQYKEYERTLMWNDCDLNIDWNNNFNPIQSEKDKVGKFFIECEKYE
jgi:dTDP-4-dehydrorhamnose 3,5-epimerase